MLDVAMSRQRAAQQHTFFNMFSSHSSLRSAAGWLFENYGHVYCSNPNRQPIQAYLRNDPEPHLIPTPAKLITCTMAAIQPPHNFYWRPRETNFPGVDAVIRIDNIVWALQFTISSSHRSATVGLTKVRNDMDHKRNLEWRLVMIGPSRREAESVRDRQTLSNRWRKTVVYACELPLDALDGNDTQRLREVLQKAGEEYPKDQLERADSDVQMASA